jgi:anaerobic ribonucleoside-triphosphate reductase activating protein
MNRDEITKEILGMSDVLVDGRFMIELKDDDIHYRGSKNQRIIDLKSSNVNNIKLLNP